MAVRYPYLGYGLGLRPNHYQAVIDQQPKRVDWFECVTEDYLVDGGNPLYFLEKIREHYPMAMHGVTLSIGSADPVNTDYLHKLMRLAERIKPAWISDHLCWSGCEGIVLHDLLPLPQTEAVVKHVVEKVDQVQAFLGQRIVLENISSYCTYRMSEMPEWEFVSQVAERSDSLILLDINNIYVNSVNHGFDPYEYIANIPIERVQQFHLAGHVNCDTHIIDTHDDAIIDPVWALYEAAAKRFGPGVSTMIERDDNIPALEELLDELDQAKAVVAGLELEVIE